MSKAEWEHKNNRQINCKHYLRESKKTAVYTYRIVGADINLCKMCERKLRKQIIDQKAIEDWSHKETARLEKALRKYTGTNESVGQGLARESRKTRRSE